MEQLLTDDLPSKLPILEITENDLPETTAEFSEEDGLDFNNVNVISLLLKL